MRVNKVTCMLLFYNREVFCERIDVYGDIKGFILCVLCVWFFHESLFGLLEGKVWLHDG